MCSGRGIIIPNRNVSKRYVVCLAVAERTVQEGVHIQDRGNVAMPVDMVKILFYVRYKGENLKRLSQKMDRIKSQLSAMADLVHGGGEVGEEERAVLERSGVLPSRKLKGKAKSRSANGPKHVVFAEEDEEVTHLEPLSSAPAPETASNGESEVDLGWKPEGRQKRNKGKQGSQGQDNSNLQLLEEESENHRRRLVRELSARMERDKQLRCAERELEMQRLLMGKGQTKKLKGVELVRDEGDEDDDEDWEDGNRPARSSEKTYKPRVYKWKAERKR